jgi:hypothetical protein
MLKSIKLIDYNLSNNIYYIRDSFFECKVTVAHLTSEHRSVGPELAVIETYKSLNQNVSRQLAHMYLFYANSTNPSILEPSILKRYAAIIDRARPDFKYTKTYYNCVLRHLGHMCSERLVRGLK